MQNLDLIALSRVVGGASSSAAELAAAKKFVNASDGDYDKAACMNGTVKVHSGEGGNWVPFSAAR
jgi:hypothetical protein